MTRPVRVRTRRRAPAAPKWRVPERLLVAIDGSRPAQKAANQAVDLAKALGATVEFVTVLDLSRLPFTYAPDARAQAMLDAAWSDAEDLVDGEKRHAQKRGVQALAKVLSGPSAAHEIVSHAERTHAQLVVVGSRGATGLRRLLLGSVATAVAHLAHCPVMVVR